MKQTDLSNIHGCLTELQDCSRGLAYFDHLFAKIVDELAEAQANYDSMEALVAAGVRSGASSALTATEVKAAINRAIEADEDRMEIADVLRLAKGRRAKIDHWVRSLEKRMSAAQSANNGHESLGRYGGGNA